MCNVGTFATSVDFGEASRLGFASLSHLHLGSNLKPGTLGIKFVHPYNPGVGVIDQSQSDVMVGHDTIGTIYCVVYLHPLNLIVYVLSNCQAEMFEYAGMAYLSPK